MATRRFTSSTDTQGKTKSWYNKIEHAGPATLQRENLMLLAEMRYELYKNRMINERILATLSTTELQNTENIRLQLANLKRIFCDQKPFKDTGACTTNVGSIEASAMSTLEKKRTVEAIILTFLDGFYLANFSEICKLVYIFQ